MNRTYLYRTAKHNFTPATRCWLRLAASAAIMAAVLLGCRLWVSSQHLQHAMPALLCFAAAVPVFWGIAGLVLLPASRGAGCTAPLIVYDAALRQAWLLVDFSFTGDAAQDRAAADNLIDSEAFRRYPDLTDATLNFQNSSWVLAGAGRNGQPQTEKFGAAYQAIGAPPLPAESGIFAGNLACGLLLAAAVIGSVCFLQIDRTQEYRAVNACAEEVSALVSVQYPDYVLVSSGDSLHPGACYLHYEKADRAEDYFNGDYYGSLSIGVEIRDNGWKLFYFNSENWYRADVDFAEEIALCGALDPACGNLPMKRFSQKWAGLQEDFDIMLEDAPVLTHDNAYQYAVDDYLAQSADYEQSIRALLSPCESRSSYYTYPGGTLGIYEFSYTDYAND